MSSIWLLHLTLQTEQCGAAMSAVSNSVLLYMLLFKASSALGVYKHLMIWYTVIELVYSTISWTTGMGAHSTDTAYVIFRKYTGAYSRSIAPFFLVDFCGVYFTLLEILAVHFIYRYFVVCDFKKVQWFAGRRLFYWIVCPVVSGFMFACVKIFAFAENEYLTNKLRPIFMEHYNLTMEEVVYNGPNYFICDEAGENCEQPALVWTVMMWMMMVLFGAVGVMFFCGYCTYRKLSTPDPHASIRTLELQKQLMTALLIQSAIPITLMYIPVIFLFMTPMMRVAGGPYVNIGMATIAVYPPLDQFAILYVIRDFRTAIKGIFRRRTPSFSSQSSMVLTSTA